jgi:hypothetical protein
LRFTLVSVCKHEEAKRGSMSARPIFKYLRNEYFITIEFLME